MPPPPSAARQPILATIGGIRLHERIGRGGSALVYRGHHPVMAIDVAVKLLDAELVDRRRFEQEARLAARLHHPHVVRLFNAGEEAGYAFLVMELVAGGDCSVQLREQGPLPWRLACAWLRDAAAGLGAAHAIGIVHRDVKPANLLLTESGTVKVADLGLARPDGLVSSAGGQHSIVGTIAYMAPEQILQPQLVGPATDVYSLGVTLFELLTGHLPFAGEEAGALLAARLDQPPSDLRDHLPQAPAALAELLQRMLARSPADRPADGTAVAAALSPLLDGSSVGAHRQPARWMLIALLAVPVLTVIAALVALFDGPPPASPATANDIPIIAPEPLRWVLIDQTADAELVATVGRAADELGWRQQALLRGSGEQTTALAKSLVAGDAVDCCIEVIAEGAAHRLRLYDGQATPTSVALDASSMARLQDELLGLTGRQPVVAPLRYDADRAAWILEAGSAHGVRPGDRFAPLTDGAPLITVRSAETRRALVQFPATADPQGGDRRAWRRVLP